jgi:seryl-tRNA synthetase
MTLQKCCNEVCQSEANSKKSIKTIKEREKEIYELKKEHTKEKEDLESTRRELKKLKAKVNRDEKKSKKNEKKDFMKNLKEAGNQFKEINCETSNEKFSSIQDLKTHRRFNHTKHEGTQTDNIELEDKSIQSTESDVVCEMCSSSRVEQDVLDFLDLVHFDVLVSLLVSKI